VSAVTARPRPAAAAVAPAAAVLVAAAACWIVAVRRMDGMDMGAATDLGPLGSFLPTWAPMMAAMMLPGAVPAIAARARTAGAGAGLWFTASYLAVWATAGLAVHALYRPHGPVAAAAVVVAAALYELTPLKRRSLRRCRDGTGSGFAYGGWCVGTSAGPMAVLLALGPMSVGWMAVVAAVVLAQKLPLTIPRRRST
jgi:predicted metal-binding membrane protein